MQSFADFFRNWDQTRVKGIVLALLAACLWGVSGTFAQFLFERRSINFEWLLTIRMLVPGILLLLYTSRQGFFKIWSIWKTRNDALALLFFGVFGMLAVQYTFFASIQHSNAATATILQFLGPVIIACYFAVKERRLPATSEALAFLCAILGTFFLVTHGRIGELSISSWALYFGILSAVALAVYSIQPLRLLGKYESAVVVGWGMLIGGISSSFFHAPWQITGVWDDVAILLTLFIVLFGSLVAFYAI